MKIKPLICLLALWASKPANAQLLFADFNETEIVSDYVSASNPLNRFFNAIGTSGTGVQLSIAQQMLKFNRTGSNTGSFSRTTNFAGSPQTLAIQLKIQIADNTSAQTSAAVLQIGSSFGTNNAAESNTNVHSRFGINLTSTPGDFTLRDLSTSTNSIVLSGLQTLTWVINNSGTTSNYLAPNGTTETVANDTWDLWAGNTKLFDDRAALSASLNLEDFKFAFTNGVGAIHFDQIQIDVGASLNHFRSANASGNWNTASDWQMSLDSTNWVVSSCSPNANARSIHIRENQQMSFSGSSNPNFCTANNLLVSATGKLHVGSQGDLLGFNQNHVLALAKHNSSNNFTNLGEVQVNENASFQCKGNMLNNGNFLVKSSSIGTGHIGNSNGGTIIGNVSVERFIPAGIRRNRSLATPVSNATLLDWKGEIYLTGNGTGNTLGTSNSNGFDATATNNPSVFWYNETVSGSVNLGWVAANDINNPLVPGRGYKVLVRGDRSDLGRLNGTNSVQNAVTLISTGTPNQGNFNFPATNITWSGSSSDDGWCFVGNPYACAINWNATSGWQRTNIDAGAIAVWNPQTNSYAYSINTAGGANPSGLSINGGSSIIASHQAFFVKTTGSNPSLSCNENVKTSQTATPLFKQGASHLIKISLEKEEDNKDEAIIQFGERYQDEELEMEDLAKLKNPVVNIGSGQNPKRWLALNALPFKYEEKFSIPIYAEIVDAASGMVSIEVKDFTNFSELYLNDLWTGKMHRIEGGFKQSFDFKTDKVNEPRFRLIGYHNQILGRQEESNMGFKVYPNPSSNKVYIQLNTPEKIPYTLTLLDLMGNVLEEIEVKNADIQSIELLQYPVGIYLLRIAQANALSVEKVIRY